METGTPGVKSTPDGWLEPRRRRTAADARLAFRAVALGPPLPRSPARRRRRARHEPRSSASTCAQREPAAARARLRVAVRASGVQRPAARHRPRDVRGGASCSRAPTPRGSTPAPTAPTTRAARFGEALRQIAQLDPGRRRPARSPSPTSTAGTRTSARAPSRASSRNRLARLRRRARRLRAAISATAWPTSSCSPCRSSAAPSRENGNRGTDHGHATAMFVLGGGVRGGTRLRPLARPRARAAATRAATSPSPPTSARSSHEVATRHLALPATAPALPRLVCTRSPSRPGGVEEPSSAGNGRQPLRRPNGAHGLAKRDHGRTRVRIPLGPPHSMREGAGSPEGVGSSSMCVSTRLASW